MGTPNAAVAGMNAPIITAYTGMRAEQDIARFLAKHRSECGVAAPVLVGGEIILAHGWIGHAKGGEQHGGAESGAVLAGGAME